MTLARGPRPSCRPRRGAALHRNGRKLFRVLSIDRQPFGLGLGWLAVRVLTVYNRRKTRPGATPILVLRRFDNERL